MIELYETKFGPYLFEADGAIVDDFPVGYALETQTRSLFDQFAHSGDNEIVVAHELAHQRYGDSVTPGRWKDVWLNEGCATYAEWLWEYKTIVRTMNELFDDAYSVPADRKSYWNPPPGDPASTRCSTRRLRARRHDAARAA